MSNIRKIIIVILVITMFVFLGLGLNYMVKHYKKDEMNVYVQMVESPTVLQKAKVTVKSNDAIEYYSMEIAWQKGGVRP